MPVMTARVTGAFASWNGVGAVHSKTGKTLNVLFEGPGRRRLVNFVPEPMAVMPDSISVDGDAWAAIRSTAVGSGVQKEGMAFHFAGHAPIGGRLQPVSCDLPVSPGGLNDTDIRSNMDAFLARYRQTPVDLSPYGGLAQRLGELAKAVLTGDRQAVGLRLPQCLGIGGGLTPSSDDMVTGLLAVMTGAALAELPWMGGEARSALLGVGGTLLDIGSLSGLTTDISLAYLACAAERRFNKLLQVFTEHIYMAQDSCFTSCFELARKIGSSSGMDMLCGAAIGCRCLLDI